MEILIIICVYIISVLLCYNYIRIAFSIKGRYNGIDSGIAELVFTFCPIVNTIFSIISWLFWYPCKQTKSTNNFFNIKKQDDEKYDEKL